jgi:parvulin-like peptidyl-prolyl isomerase
LVLEVRAVKKISQNKTVVAVAKALHLSAAKINGDRVSYSDYVGDLQTLNQFYAKNTSVAKPTDEQISDQVISRLLANKLITRLGDEFKVKVEASDLDGFKKTLLDKFKTEEEAEKELQASYGWTLQEYISKVVNPILLEQKVQKAFEESNREDLQKYMDDQVHARHILFMVTDPKDDAKVKAQAQSVLDQIKKGADFTAMAKKYGSDATKDQGGDLGWFSRGEMVPEFETAAFALKAGELDSQLVIIF